MSDGIPIRDVAAAALPYRPPFDWPAIHGFLATRAVPGVESAQDGRYARTIRLDGLTGSFTVAPSSDGDHLRASIRFPDASAHSGILARIRRLFDLDADPAAIGRHLAGERRLADLVAARPGLRVPGTWSGFELAVRGILGQQVSVAAATRLAGRLVAVFGTRRPANEAEPGLTHVFPTPEALAEADVALALNMPRARGAAIRALAVAAMAEPDLFAAGQGLEAAVARLKALQGIGDWTAHYVAMRALRHPDAFPSGDIGLLRALDGGEGRPSPAAMIARAELWRPYRAYAAMHLWSQDAATIAAEANATLRARSRPRDTRSIAPRDADIRRKSRDAAARVAVHLGSTTDARETGAVLMLDQDSRDERTAFENADDARWMAFAARDRSAEGRFVAAVHTTGIYCRPGCPARTPKRGNVAFYATCEEAETAGFRACRRCRPNEAPGEPAQAAIERACRLIEAAETPPSLDALSREAGLSPFHFHRVFKRITGVTPKAYAAAHRSARVAQGLREARSVTEAVFDAGYNASSRFYADAAARLGMSPSAYRGGGAGAAIRYAVSPCALGRVLVGATDLGVCAIMLGDDPDALGRDLRARFPNAAIEPGDADFGALVARVVALVEAPGACHDLPLDIVGTAFQQRVWAALQAIPAGSTATYAEVARRIGAPGAVRAVARACADNRIAVAIPCHRVVRSDGGLSGYRWGVGRKRALLEREGVRRSEPT